MVNSDDGATEGIEYSEQDQSSAQRRDNSDGSFWDVEDPFPVEASLRIRYIDWMDNRSERTVAVSQFGALRGGHLIIIGHCQLRDATRTFRVDRVEHCTDTETGQVVTDIADYLQNKHKASPALTRKKLLAEEFDTLRVLLYIGKADGQLRKPEKAIIREACRAMSGDSALTDDDIDELFRSVDVPTIHAFKLAVHRMKERSQDMQCAIFGASRAIVATQKTLHYAEAEALEYMRKKFDIVKPLVAEQSDFPALSVDARKRRRTVSLRRQA